MFTEKQPATERHEHVQQTGKIEGDEELDRAKRMKPESETYELSKDAGPDPAGGEPLNCNPAGGGGLTRTDAQ